ncbi:hypothetical protein Enr13x_77510 [Stieleria neptunia]|uniref:Uncharacterized protein n=1 Tax=Stieleria neptunia TaxID=2527979 RepID=A0A518I402_9BACT|nr:hypothetical protein Enr13x_77510 [Stieleria neptunia]
MVADSAPGSERNTGILVAKTTGHTIARLRHVSATPASRSCARAVCARAVLVLLTVCWAIGDAPSVAEGPAGKSRYRSATHGRSTADDRGDGNDAERNSNLFGLRSLWGGNSDGTSSRGDELLDALPMDRLTTHAKVKLAGVTEKPTLYRRLPTQAIRCDEELFLFLTRKPEAIIGIWDLMGITNVQATRTGPYQLDAVDGSGTTCQIDLLYGDRNLHVFMADGMYDGKFVQKPILGKGVFVFKSTYAVAADGSTTVTGILDCYIKFESLGADIIARSLGGLIGKSADHNFVETAKFISQISQACEKNPEGMLEMVDRMPQIDAQTKAEFARTIINVSQRYLAKTLPTAKLVQDRGIQATQR